MTEIARPGKFCPECAAPLTPDPDATETVAMKAKSPSSHSSEDEGRFAPGVLLADRYRVISVIGRGGMGEVYRASDLKLSQPVALKFLPSAIAKKPGLLERFHSEVRIARQVSHPNVCRVYDIGEAEGSAFISMEYVDGEDLGSLLRRIGRLPSDKAVEIGRKLCAGLAAAHAKGVLHRDLKPGNIMIDGRGQVLIMDFGLAALADSVAGAEVRNGTPAYMAPEQLSGKEVSERSDIYALGLVLHEIFTGQRAFKTADRSNIPSAVSIVRDVDPVVDRVIARCLDPDPGKRPQSALAVARMLPGGNPLAETLAAGDTPTPAMVAASDEMGVLSVRMIAACMAVIVLSLASYLWISRYNLMNLSPFPYSAEVLALKAREMAARLGYPEPPVGTAQHWVLAGFPAWAQENLKREEYFRLLPGGQPAPYRFEYAQSPISLTHASSHAYLRADDEERVPGQLSIVLDPQARLLEWRAVSPRMETGTASVSKMDWTKLFKEAGLDPARWTPAEPLRIPTSPFDERAAWTGTFANAPTIPLRMEAGAWRGRLVSFDLGEPWRGAPRSGGPGPLIAIVSLFGTIGVWLTVRNLKAGRSDNAGAFRLAIVVFLSLLLGTLSGTHYTLLADIFGVSVFAASLVWVGYVALEPNVRRYWPQALISWTRLLSGDWRNPVVAGHVLVGIAAALLIDLLVGLRVVFISGLALVPTVAWLDPVTLVGREWIAAPLSSLNALFFFFLLFVARLLLRRTWLAAIVPALVVVLLSEQLSTLPATGARFVTQLLMVTVGVRFGLLPLLLVFAFSLVRFPFTTDLSVWYAKLGWMQVAFTLGIAVWAFRAALGGRKLMAGDLLER